MRDGVLRPFRGGAIIAIALLAVSAVGLGACQGPEAIVQTAIDAARDGDRDTFAACFTRRSRPMLQAWWLATDAKNPALGGLGAAADISFEGVRPLPRYLDSPESRLVLLREAGKRLRVVVHNEGGAWRIDLLDTERRSANAGDF